MLIGVGVLLVLALAATALVASLRPTSIVERTLTGHTDIVEAVAVGQLDNRPVVVSGSGDKTVRVWDMATGVPVGQPFTGHTGIVVAVATASIDGQTLIISGGRDTTIRTWDLAARAHT